jgi:hypothetical protein
VRQHLVQTRPLDHVRFSAGERVGAITPENPSCQGVHARTTDLCICNACLALSAVNNCAGGPISSLPPRLVFSQAIVARAGSFSSGLRESGVTSCGQTQEVKTMAIRRLAVDACIRWGVSSCTPSSLAVPSVFLSRRGFATEGANISSYQLTPVEIWVRFAP